LGGRSDSNYRSLGPEPRASQRESLAGTFPGRRWGCVRHLRPILPRSRHRPVPVTEGSLTKNLNKTGVRFWTDIPPTTVHTKAGVQRVLVCSENTHPAGDNATPLSVSNAVELRLNVIANHCNQHLTRECPRRKTFTQIVNAACSSTSARTCALGALSSGVSVAQRRRPRIRTGIRMRRRTRKGLGVGGGDRRS
jgi:hypothetical protein